MRLEGRYTSADIYAEEIEESAIQQVYDIINCKAFDGCRVVCMPDAHTGKSGPCGLVAEIKDYVCPEHVGVDIGCFPENEKVKLTDGRSLSFKELIEEFNSGHENFTYSINDNGNVCITKIVLPSYVKTVNKICEIKLDNDKTINCTLDHKIMLRNGTYIEAQFLKENDSLMPLYIDTCKNQENNMDHKIKGFNMHPYLVIYDPKINKYRYIHFLADEYNENIFGKQNGNIRHHIDFNKYNNNPTNIYRCNYKEHWKIHNDHVKETNKLGITGFKRANELHPGLYSKAGKIGMTKNHNTPSFTEKCRQRIIECNKHGKNYEYATSEENKKRVAKLGQEVFKKIKLNPEYYIKVNLQRCINYIEYLLSEKLNIDKETYDTIKKTKNSFRNIYCYDALLSVLNSYNYKYDTLKLDIIKQIHNSIIIKNHKVKSVKIYDAPNTKVYCLLNQQYSNFALDAGIFVHNCSVSMVKYKGTINVSDYASIEHKIKNAVPMGNNVHQRCVIDEKAFRKFLSNEFQKAKQMAPEYVSSLPDIVTEEWISKVCKRVGIDEGKFWKSIGTVGGCNHYEEIDVDDKGNYALNLHFGSRNFGLKVAKYWTKVANEGMPKDEVARLTREFRDKYTKSHDDMTGFKDELGIFISQLKNSHVRGYLTGDDMKGYLCDMVFAQAYARYNHYVVQDIINNILKKHGLVPFSQVMTTHNYIDFRSMTLRKSAISAYEGEKVLIPFNMRDGIAECTGLGNTDWLCSAPHGAGRKMSRTRAKAEISIEKMQKDMEGICTTSVCQGTIDEAPDAYKDTDSIKHQIDGITVKIDRIWKPVINIKAAS